MDLKNKKVWLICGTGGVGKTTLTSALGFYSSLQDQKSTSLITVDPSKRLIRNFTKTKKNLSKLNLTSELRNFNPKSAPLEIIAPHSDSAFSEFLNSVCESKSQAEKMQKNAIFQNLTREFAGAHDYLSLYALDELLTNSHSERILIDTPPSRNALSFLNSPDLFHQFFEDRFFKWATQNSSKFLAFGAHKAGSLLGKLTGSQFITDMMDFSTNLLYLQPKLIQKISNLKKTLHSPDLGILLVVSLRKEQLEETKKFLKFIAQKNLKLSAVILNRDWTLLKKNESQNSIAIDPILEKLYQEQKNVKDDFLRLFEKNPKSSSEVQILSVGESSKDILDFEDLVAFSRSHILDSLFDSK